MTEQIENTEAIETPVQETTSEVPTVQEAIETPVPEVQETPTFVPFPKPPTLDSESKTDDTKTTKVMFLYPQCQEPQISVDGGEFIKLPWNSSQTALNVRYKDHDIFPLVVVFKNEYRTYRKQVFEYYGGIDSSQVSIQRTKD